MIRLRHALAVALALWTMGSCQDTDFRGESTRQPAAPPPAVEVYSSCTQGPVQTVDVHGRVGAKLVIEGELCPVAQANLNLVFVVDRSGSMGESDPSCQRLAAVEGVVRALQAPGVRFGLIAFSSKAEAVLPLQAGETFLSNNLVSLCDNQGGTNYEAAFGSALAMVRGQQGTSVVNFITDGAPTVWSGGTGPAQRYEVPPEALKAGRDASASLRAVAQLQALYLKSSEQIPGFDPIAYLAELTTGNPQDQSRVREAANAQLLGRELSAMARPVVQLVDGDVQGAFGLDQGSLSGPNGSSVPVTLTLVRPGVWKFRTSALEPPPANGTYRLVVSAGIVGGGRSEAVVLARISLSP